MNDTINKIKYNELKQFFQLEKNNLFLQNCEIIPICHVSNLATKSEELFVFN